MRFSIGLTVALSGMASAITSYNATFHVSKDCSDSDPLFNKGEKWTNCVNLDKTFNAIKAWEDTPLGYCHYRLFSDKNCKTEIKKDQYIEMDGSCLSVAGIESFNAACYR